MSSFSPSQGLGALAYLMGSDETQAGVLNVDWEAWRGFHPEAAGSPLLADLLSSFPQEGARETAKSLTRTAPLRSQWRSWQLEEREQALESYLRSQIGDVLHLDSEALQVHRDLTELGLDSLMAMEIIRRMEADLDIRVYPREIFEQPSIRALTDHLSAELDRAWSSSSPTRPEMEAVERRTGTLSAPEALAAVTGGMISQPYSDSGKRNPGAIFLLSTPRAGSTLLRVMLAGHPDLFSPPELHLLPFNTMRQRQEDLALTFLDEGLHRALMNLKRFDAERSKAQVKEWVEKEVPIQEVYRSLQSLAGGQVLVDKSPSYAAKLETLRRAEAMFEQPKYIHLVRHPYAVIESAARIRLDSLLGAGEVDPYRFSEHLWTTMNENILRFSQQVDPDRYLLLRYEDLVREPEQVMRHLCDFLGIAFNPALLTPYAGDRMTDGVYDSSLSVGDPNFHRHKRIDPDLGGAWREVKLPGRLADETQGLARKLGYDLPQEQESLSSRVKWPSVVPIQPEGSRRPFFLVHPGSGLVYFYYQLGQLLGPDQPFYALQDPSLSGEREPYDRIEDYAQEYVEAIRALQPQGPYRLGGWSFGGQVAFEMANQLQAAGQQVDLLALLDTEAPLANRKISPRQRIRYWKNRLVESSLFLRDVAPYARDGFYLLVVRDKLALDHPAREMSRLEYFQWIWADAIHRRLARRAGMGMLISQDASFLRMRIPTVRRVLRVLSHHIRVVGRYHPHIYPGDLTLLRAEEQVRRQFFTDSELGWGELVSGVVAVKRIPGNHVTMFKQPHVETVADVLQACIDQAEAA
jgi:thioesterase domain-containing protein/acyl carrier protein